MLRRFIYLDTVALRQYVTALEGGQTSESRERSKRTGTGGGGVDIKVASVTGEKSVESERETVASDTDEARFDRLLKAAAADADALAWVEVLQPDVDFADAPIGAMVSWECDIYVPEIIQQLSKTGELRGMLDTMKSMLPAVQALGLDDGDDLPDVKEVDAMASFVDSMNADLVLVGDDEDTDWRVAGRLAPAFLAGTVEGRVRLVGKITKEVRPGTWVPFLTFPGMNLLSREKRREMARQKPAEGEEDQYLSGPAVMLDILAVYR